MKINTRITSEELQTRLEQYCKVAGISKNAAINVALASFLPAAKPEAPAPAPKPKRRTRAKPKPAEFVAPTREEVDRWYEEKGFPQVAQTFWDAMQTSNWHYGTKVKHPLKCWESHANKYIGYHNESAANNKKQSAKPWKGAQIDAGNFDGGELF